MTFIINIIGIVLIALTIWFFFMKKEEQATKVRNHQKIIVDGGYQPSVIEVQVGQSLTLEFVRHDQSSCLEEVVIPDFKIREFLPLHQPTEITLTPTVRGEFSFHCGMSMFFGKIKVV